LETGNVIRNPRFEKLTQQNTAEGWVRYNNMGKPASDKSYLEVDNKTFKSLPISGGFNAMKIFNTPGEPASMLAQNNIPVEPGASYMMTLVHKEMPSFGGKIYICVNRYIQPGKPIPNNSKTYYFETGIQPSLDWSTFTKKLKVENNVTSLAIHIVPNGAGACWIKEVKLVKIATPESKAH
jgi:hypothetical protein